MRKKSKKRTQSRIQSRIQNKTAKGNSKGFPKLQGHSGLPLVNREYKSSVFALLYQDRGRLLSLYNALNNRHYRDPQKLQIVTLENAIYMAMKNDNAFILAHTLNLYEHQSTPNPNMPLRHLFYVSREYEKLVVKQSLYSRRKIQIPNPRFVVFYNGMEKQPERQILKLSDLYEVEEVSPMLELEVLFLNINKGYNGKLKEECKSLGEYMLFVERIRRYAEGTRGEERRLEEAVERAISECIKEGILADFLLSNRAEVVAMSIFEYDEEKELKLYREAEYLYGLEEGIEKGVRIGEEKGIRIGEEKGIKIGEEKGIKIGEEKGLQAMVTSLKPLLSDYEAVYQTVTANEAYRDYTREQVRKYYTT